MSVVLCAQTPGDDDVEPHYRRVLSELAEAQTYALNIDCQALYEHSAECSRLYDQLVKYPPEVRMGAAGSASPRRET